MLIPIPVGQQFSVTLKTQNLRTIPCEKCGHSFAFVIKREFKGVVDTLPFADSDYALKVAHARAEAQERHAMGIGFAAAYCPYCGWMQAFMVQRLKRDHLLWLLITGGAVAICGGLFALVFTVPHIDHRPAGGPPLWPGFNSPWLPVAFGVLFLLGLAAIVTRQLLVRRFNPNAQPTDWRLAMSERNAITLEKLRKLQSQAARYSPSYSPPPSPPPF